MSILTSSRNSVRASKRAPPMLRPTNVISIGTSMAKMRAEVSARTIAYTVEPVQIAAVWQARAPTPTAPRPRVLRAHQMVLTSARRATRDGSFLGKYAKHTHARAATDLLRMEWQIL